MDHETVPYKTIGDVTLSLSVFRPGREPTGTGMVFFHGGGWSGGTPEQFYPHCAHLAARGMLAISAEYRLTGRHGTTPYDCVTDGRSAMRWVRAHAGDLGIDADRIAGGGGSAGGHVAAATALVEGFDDPDDDTTVDCRPDALVLYNPVFDNGPGGFGHDQVKERWREFSPLHNLRQGAPPTMVCLGSEDRLLASGSVLEYARRMDALGSRCDVQIYGGQQHGFFNFRDGENPYYDTTVASMDAFLVTLGYLRV